MASVTCDGESLQKLQTEMGPVYFSEELLREWEPYSKINMHTVSSIEGITIVLRRLLLIPRDHSFDNTVHPWLSESWLSNTSIIPTPKVIVLLEYFSIGVCYFGVNDCSIRKFGRNPV